MVESIIRQLANEIEEELDYKGSSGVILMELREFLFTPLGKQQFDFAIWAKETGIFAGATELTLAAKRLGLLVEWVAPEGYRLRHGSCVFRGRGEGYSIARAEELLLGLIGKPSGVATIANSFVKEAAGRVNVVCGAWKKVDPSIRKELRKAIAIGGVGIRLTEEPFIYIDKNYVRMFGGVDASVKRAKAFSERRVISVQIRGEMMPIREEALMAIKAGADILMIDTGELNDLIAAKKALDTVTICKTIKLAFSGGIKLGELQPIIDAGTHFVDVGRAIIDGILLDFSLDVRWN